MGTTQLLDEIEERTATSRAEFAEELHASAVALDETGRAARRALERAGALFAEQHRSRNDRALGASFRELQRSSSELSTQTSRTAAELLETAARIAEGSRAISERMAEFAEVARAAKLLAVNAFVRSLRMQEGAVLRTVVEQIEVLTRDVARQAKRLDELAVGCAAEVDPLERAVQVIAGRAAALEHDGQARHEALEGLVARIEGRLDELLEASRGSSSLILEESRGAARSLALGDELEERFDALEQLQVEARALYEGAAS